MKKLILKSKRAVAVAGVFFAPVAIVGQVWAGNLDVLQCKDGASSPSTLTAVGPDLVGGSVSSGNSNLHSVALHLNLADQVEPFDVVTQRMQATSMSDETGYRTIGWELYGLVPDNHLRAYEAGIEIGLAGGPGANTQTMYRLAIGNTPEVLQSSTIHGLFSALLEVVQVGFPNPDDHKDLASQISKNSYQFHMTCEIVRGTPSVAR